MEQNASDRFKRFATRLKNGKVQNAIEAWLSLLTFEENVRRIHADITPQIEASLSKKPGDRSFRDIERLLPVIQRIKAFSVYENPVIELIARYSRLDIIIESMELPKGPSDRSKVYSVISGAMKGIVADCSDPQLMILARTAAEQLVKMETSQKEFTADDKASKAALLSFVSEAPRLESKFESLIRLGLGSEYHLKRVRKGIWRECISIVHSGGLPSRQKSLARIDELGIEIDDDRKSSVSSGVSLLDLETGSSFSGWDLDCKSEGGVKLEAVAPLPPKVQGVVTEPNSLVALVYVTKGVYRRAIQMQLDLMAKREVDACCRFPFLRHSPLKEIFDIAKHLQVIEFIKGDLLLSQGKESVKSPILFLLEGEVELSIDLPLTQDKNELSAAFEAILGVSASGHHKPQLQSSSSLSSVHRPVQRVVLGKRSGGVILGDEALREDRVMTTIIAASRCKVLSIPSARFSASLDPLTQRLFQKPRTQKSTAQFISSMAAGGIGDVRMLVERCRSEILSLTYDGTESQPSTLNRSPSKQLKAWHNAGSDSHPSPSKLSPLVNSLSPSLGSSQPQLPFTGLSVSRLSDVAVSGSESMRSFVTAVKELEEQRRAQLASSLKRSIKVDPTLDALGLSRRLDLSATDQGSSHGRYTELYEAGCLAIIRVVEKPGQAYRPSLTYALCMDEVIAEWQAIAHNNGLQLIRWSCQEFYLLGRPLSLSSIRDDLDTANTSVVRNVADSTLLMLEVFEKVNGRSEVNHSRIIASITLGPLFLSFDCGRFVVGLSGHAFDAASVLCEQLSEDNGAGSSLRNTICLSDAMMMAVSRTHCCLLDGSSYCLIGRNELPHGTSFEALFNGDSGSSLKSKSRSFHYCNGGALHCSIDDGLGGSPLDTTTQLLSNLSPSASPRLVLPPPGPTSGSFDANKLKALWGRGGLPPPCTLEPRLTLTKTSNLFNKASSATTMSIRQQLRKEVEDIRRSKQIIMAPVEDSRHTPPSLSPKKDSWKDCGAPRALSEFIADLDETLVSLSLSSSGLKVFPNLSRLSYLQSLSVSFNQFGLHLNSFLINRSITNPLSLLPSSLRTLSLSHNGITSLPDDLFNHLPLIKGLNLSSNCLTALPSSISKLTALESLSAERNRLETIDASGLNALVALTALFLGQNELTSIGFSSSALSGLTSLKKLDVSLNSLQFLPPALSNLPSLQTLVAGYNLLETLPDGFLSSQIELTRLELQGNSLCNCPQVTGMDLEVLEALNLKYSEDVDADNLDNIDEDSVPAQSAPMDAFPMLATASLTSPNLSGPSAYGQANPNPSFFRSRSIMRSSQSMKQMGSKRASALAYTPTPEPHLGVNSEDMNPCQLASSAAQDPKVVKLFNLISLDLSSNGLLALPPWLPPSLLSLAASNNRLESVHAWLAERLVGLRVLDLQSNRIKHLSRALSQLNDISCVCLADNPCVDVDAAAGGAEMASWLEDHVIKLKYNKKVQNELNLV